MQKEFASRKFYAFLNAYCLKPHLIKSLNSLDSFRTYGRLLKIKKKQRPLVNYICLKMISKIVLQKFFQKNKHPNSGGLETNWSHEIQNWFLHMPSYIWTQYKNCFGHLIGTSSKCHKFWGQNIKSVKMAAKLNFTIFWALYFWKS